MLKRQEILEILSEAMEINSTNITEETVLRRIRRMRGIQFAYYR